MSFCRFSSDDHQCDVYCYESCYGRFVTHVAASRYVFTDPLPSPVDIKDIKAFVNRMMQVSGIVRKSSLVPIGLSADRQMFGDDTLKELVCRLKGLKDMGYRVPAWVVENIEKEIRDEGNRCCSKEYSNLDNTLAGSEESAQGRAE